MIGKNVPSNWLITINKSVVANEPIYLVTHKMKNINVNSALFLNTERKSFLFSFCDLSL